MAWYNPLTWPKYIKRVVGGAKKRHPELNVFFDQFETDMGRLVMDIGKITLSNIKTLSVPTLAAEILAVCAARGVPIVAELAYNVARVLLFAHEHEAKTALADAVMSPVGLV